MITADLESMKEAGIGNVIFLEVNVGVPRGNVDFLGEEWQDIFTHAMKECKRLGITMSLGVGPGWTGSGGPWVQAEESMCHLVDGEFSWCPTFTYQGFRYAEISGIDYMPEIDDFVGKVNYDKMETIGSFESSDETINSIYKNAYWGIRGNYRSFPTDCPQRDERMAWLGDRSAGCYGESFIFDQAKKVKKAYNRNFLDKENLYYGNNTVTANLVSPMGQSNIFDSGRSGR